MTTEFIQDFIHLKCGRKRFDQNGRLDGAYRNAEGLLREFKDFIPQARFKVALHLRQIVERTEASGVQFRAIVEDVQSEIEQARGDRLTINQQMRLLHMPSARTHDHHCRLFSECVGFAGLRIGIVQIAAGIILHVDLTIDHVAEGG